MRPAAVIVLMREREGHTQTKSHEKHSESLFAGAKKKSLLLSAYDVPYASPFDRGKITGQAVSMNSLNAAKATIATTAASHD